MTNFVRITIEGDLIQIFDNSPLYDKAYSLEREIKSLIDISFSGGTHAHTHMLNSDILDAFSSKIPRDRVYTVGLVTSSWDCMGPSWSHREVGVSSGSSTTYKYKGSMSQLESIRAKMKRIYDSHKA